MYTRNKMQFVIKKKKSRLLFYLITSWYFVQSLS